MFWTDFEKILKYQTFSESRVVPWEEIDKQIGRRTDMTKLIVTFLIFANLPFSPTVPPSAVRCSRVVTRVETPGGESWKV